MGTVYLTLKLIKPDKHSVHSVLFRIHIPILVVDIDSIWSRFAFILLLCCLNDT